MKTAMTVKTKVHFGRGRESRKEVRKGAKPDAVPGRVPRVTKLMALAIRFEQMVRDGEVADYTELARLGHVTRARITQIMNLLNLAPDIQEILLFLPAIESGRDPITERDIRRITGAQDWRVQRKMWAAIACGPM